MPWSTKPATSGTINTSLATARLLLTLISAVHKKLLGIRECAGFKDPKLARDRSCSRNTVLGGPGMKLSILVIALAQTAHATLPVAVTLIDEQG